MWFACFECFTIKQFCQGARFQAPKHYPKFSSSLLLMSLEARGVQIIFEKGYILNFNRVCIHQKKKKKRLKR